MRFDTKQLLERLTLALGVAAVGIALLATDRAVKRRPDPCPS